MANQVFVSGMVAVFFLKKGGSFYTEKLVRYPSPQLYFPDFIPLPTYTLVSKHIHFFSVKN
jgi:hypothetical protein